MGAIFLKRILLSIPTLWVLATVAFFLVRLAPGGPFDSDKELPEEIQIKIETKYGLDQPLSVQYVSFIKQILQADLGPSYQYKDFSVNQLIAQGFPVSFKIGALAILLALVVGVSIGCFAAVYKNKWIDHLLMSVSLFGISIPNFVIAPLMLLFFSVNLGWLPAGGWNDGHWKNLVLPVISLSLPFVASISRLMKSSMQSTLSSDYIRTAKAKGLSTASIVVKHALKPSLLPIISYLGPTVAGVITGSVVIEKIFGLPGIGNYFVQGALNRDYTLMLGVILFFGALIIIFNLLVDLTYLLLDPKMRSNF